MNKKNAFYIFLRVGGINFITNEQETYYQVFFLLKILLREKVEEHFDKISELRLLDSFKQKCYISSLLKNIAVKSNKVRNVESGKILLDFWKKKTYISFNIPYFY